MFDIVKVIIDLLKSSMNLSKLKDEKRRKEIGVSLFSVYVNLNQVLVVGYDIIETLETCLQENTLRIREGRRPYSFYVKVKLEEQKTNIERFALSAQELIYELHVLDGRFVRDIHRLMSGKVSMLGELLRILGNGSMPLNDEVIDFNRDIKEDIFNSVFHRTRNLDDLYKAYKLEGIGIGIEHIE